jgi:hypothetical protein
MGSLMMRARPVASRLSSAIVFLLALVPAANAASVYYGIDAGIGESDNVTLVSTNKISQTIAVMDADFAVKQQSRRLDLDAKGLFSYFDYLQNAYSGKLIGRFDGLAKFALVPEHLTWALQDSYGDVQIDPFTALTPTNQEHVNYLRTGPDVVLRLGPTVFMDMNARYTRTQYETSPFDSNQFSGSVALRLPLSARSSASVDVSSERVLFTNTAVNTDFDRSSGYGHYELSGARTDLTVNLGVTKVTQGNETTTGPLAKVELSRKLSTASKVTFTVGRDLTDASTSFSAVQSGAIGGITIAPPAVTSANYTVTYVSVGWQYELDRTTLGLSGRWEKDSYGGQPLLDLNRSNAEVSIQRRLTHALTAQLLGSLYRTDYAYTNFTDTDGRVGGALTYHEGRGLEIRLRYDHTSRVVSVFGGGYTENRVFLTIGYRPEKARSL